jgi:hypothetical protein
MAGLSASGKSASRGSIRVWRFSPPCKPWKSSRDETGFPQTAADLEMCVMNLLFEDLPEEIQDAYKDSVIHRTDLGISCGEAVIEAILIVDNSGGIIYTTRDSGGSFLVEKITDTVHLSANRGNSEKITVHPLVSFSPNHRAII